MKWCISSDRRCCIRDEPRLAIAEVELRPQETQLGEKSIALSGLQLQLGVEMHHVPIDPPPPRTLLLDRSWILSCQCVGKAQDSEAYFLHCEVVRRQHVVSCDSGSMSAMLRDRRPRCCPKVRRPPARRIRLAGPGAKMGAWRV